MTVNELVEWCNANNVSLDTHIAMRSKDDYFLTEEGVYPAKGYFGNSHAGDEWQTANTPRDENGELDYDNAPDVLILDTDYS